MFNTHNCSWVDCECPCSITDPMFLEQWSGFTVSKKSVWEVISWILKVLLRWQGVVSNNYFNCNYIKVDIVVMEETDRFQILICISGLLAVKYWSGFGNSSVVTHCHSACFCSWLARFGGCWLYLTFLWEVIGALSNQKKANTSDLSTHSAIQLTVDPRMLVTKQLKKLCLYHLQTDGLL